MLATIALIQIGLTLGAGLSPWLGGGFGMFSTLDTWQRRRAHAVIERDGVRREASFGPEVAEELRPALAFPSDRHLRRLARRLAEQPSPDEGAVRAVEIEIHRTRFDPETLAPRLEPIRSYELRFDDPR